MGGGGIRKKGRWKGDGRELTERGEVKRSSKQRERVEAKRQMKTSSVRV